MMAPPSPGGARTLSMQAATPIAKHPRERLHPGSEDAQRDDMQVMMASTSLSPTMTRGSAAHFQDPYGGIHQPSQYDPGDLGNSVCLTGPSYLNNLFCAGVLGVGVVVVAIYSNL